MTNDKIIIDGVDVSECGFLVIQQHSDMESDGIFYSCYNKDCEYSICSNNFDCIYKQLARKTQECEELKDKNTKLEKKLELIPCANEALQIGYTAYKKQTEYLLGICDRYRKALEEIEEIVKGMRSVFIEEISITAGQLNDRIYRESTARFRQILDIINKVKEGKNEYTTNK